MRIAIVHDDLMRRGGAEQVVLSMLKAYPDAALYTLCYRPDLTYPEFKNYKINTSLFNYIAKSERIMKILFFPIGVLCAKKMVVRNYDVVIISTTYCAKYVSIDKKSLIFMYIHTPFRLAWNPTSYTEYNKSKGLKRVLFDSIIRALQKIDVRESKKGNHFISITKETTQRIRRAYGIEGDIQIIHPPVKCSNFYVKPDSTRDYYLIVSRLEYYKNVDLAINAFSQLGFKLIIVGNGSQKNKLKAMSKSNIEFRSGLSAAELADLYANCRAFILPQHEDYGITPLEANASGRPVIAFEAGGVIETMVPYTSKDKKFTAIFFKQQVVSSLIEAVKQFESLESEVDSQYIRSHSE